MLRQHLEQQLRDAVAELFPELPSQQVNKTIRVERSEPEHGDYATNAALVLTKTLRRKPMDIAAALCEAIKAGKYIEQVAVAPPGFINFRITKEAIATRCGSILNDDNYGGNNYGDGQKVLLEYVSANPTGPLHIGHGRGAVFGNILARLLTACGYTVETEYYLNDAGRQIDILGTCIWLRYLQQSGFEHCGKYPAKGYQGDYINSIAAGMADPGDSAWPDDNAWPDESAESESYLDALISLAKQQSCYEDFKQKGLETISADIKEDLELTLASPQNWLSEKALFAEGAVEKALKLLDKRGHTEHRDGATWFKASKLGDEKDRVLVRETGQETYFLADIAYHLNKYQRGYDLILNIWGSDHHGYVPRLKAAVAACGEDQDKLEIILLQFVSLRNAEEQISMSTRAGQYLTLRQLRELAGRDATRFFYVTRKGEQHLDFDLELAQSQSNDNPVYYVQYAHARICSIMGKAPEWKEGDMTILDLPTERKIMMELLSFPDMVLESTLRREPHRITYYLRELATLFHSYYNETKVLTEDKKTCAARLTLIMAIKTVLHNGLALLAVDAPEQM